MLPRWGPTIYRVDTAGLLGWACNRIQFLYNISGRQGTILYVDDTTVVDRDTFRCV